jgi:hypothetical protein
MVSILVAVGALLGAVVLGALVAPPRRAGLHPCWQSAPLQ